jgi:glycerol-3-phosphate O-acyltransferase/dihydroxyacetone phosphate acyltransferase
MFWKFLRLIFLPYLHVYFRKQKGINLDKIRVNAPIIIALNHPNAFIDSIAFSCILYNPRTYYMARGDAFKKGLISKILTAIGIIPIFRLRDGGIEGVKKNNESFSIAYKKLNEEKKIIVFPEGLCIQERRLRPIQKGLARMAFGFSQEMKRDDLIIIPVSVTYSHPSKFGSDILYEAGNPIEVKNYLSDFKDNSIKAINDLTRDIENELKKVTPHLLNKENDQLIEQIQEIYKEQYLTEENYNVNDLANHRYFWFYITEKLNNLYAEFPEKITKLKQDSIEYYLRLKEYKLIDKSIYYHTNNKSTGINYVFSYLILLFPFYFITKLLFFIPKYFAKLTADKTCKNIEFYASVNFVTGAIYTILYSIIELIILYLLFGNWWIITIYLITKIILFIPALNYSRNLNFYISELNLFFFKKHKKNKLQQLINIRKEIIEAITDRKC